MMEKREEVMLWWNNLSNETKIIYADYYYSRLFENLTGREIQLIWEQEIAEKDEK